MKLLVLSEGTWFNTENFSYPDMSGNNNRSLQSLGQNWKKSDFLKNGWAMPAQLSFHHVSKYVL